MTEQKQREDNARRQAEFAERQREMGRKKYSYWMTPEESEAISVQIDQLRLGGAFPASDYSHIAHDTDVKVSLTASEAAAVLCAYDIGISGLSGSERKALDTLIGKLKDQIWP